MIGSHSVVPSQSDIPRLGSQAHRSTPLKGGLSCTVLVCFVRWVTLQSPRRPRLPLVFVEVRHVIRQDKPFSQGREPVEEIGA